VRGKWSLVVEALGGSLECQGVCIVSHGAKELLIFHHQDGFGFQVVVVGGVFIDDSFHYV
jgi:hypothetical protein